MTGLSTTIQLKSNAIHVARDIPRLEWLYSRCKQITKETRVEGVSNSDESDRVDQDANDYANLISPNNKCAPASLERNAA